MFYVIYEKDTQRLNFRRVPCSFFALFFHINRQARFKFHGKFVLIDDDLFNQPPDKLFIIFGKSGGLFL